jgi:hypothetical protein
MEGHAEPRASSAKWKRSLRRQRPAIDPRKLRHAFISASCSSDMPIVDRFSKVVGRTGFEPVTSSVSVQGSYLARSQDLAMGGSGGEPGESLCGVVAVISVISAVTGLPVVAWRAPDRRVPRSSAAPPALALAARPGPGAVPARPSAPAMTQLPLPMALGGPMCIPRLPARQRRTAQADPHRKRALWASALPKSADPGLSRPLRYARRSAPQISSPPIQLSSSAHTAR